MIARSACQLRNLERFRLEPSEVGGAPSDLLSSLYLDPLKTDIVVDGQLAKIECGNVHRKARFYVEESLTDADDIRCPCCRIPV